jgi:thermostable 8-oxoguanine DNA glycosylase
MRLDIVEQKVAALTPGTVFRYSSYWSTIRPYTQAEMFKRWVFAALSIRASWQKNRAAYLEVVTRPWETKEELSKIIVDTKIGLINRRVETIWRLREKCAASPRYLSADYTRDQWSGARDEFVSSVYGLGRAKVSFALEMCYPRECRVVCLDTHILQLYELNGNSVTEKNYRVAEKHWVQTCDKYNYPVPIVRHVLWDEKQGKDDTRYWSDVLEAA